MNLFKLKTEKNSKILITDHNRRCFSEVKTPFNLTSKFVNSIRSIILSVIMLILQGYL